MRNYRIKYKALSKEGILLKEGQVIAKNKLSEFDALAGTEMYLSKKIDGFSKMVCVQIEVDTIIGYIPTGTFVGNDFFKGL